VGRSAFVYHPAEMKRYEQTFYPLSFTMTAHTIVLIQKNKNKNSKTFSDYETVALAMEGS
jgi:hypothetical protein